MSLTPYPGRLSGRLGKGPDRETEAKGTEAMGFYIETGTAKGKADALIATEKAIEVGPLKSISECPDGMTLVVVMDNGLFEAAGVAFSDKEIGAFTGPGDNRPRRFLLMDSARVRELAHVPESVTL